MGRCVQTFWSPELKKERALRKEESAKVLLDQPPLGVAVQHMAYLVAEDRCDLVVREGDALHDVKLPEPAQDAVVDTA